MILVIFFLKFLCFLLDPFWFFSLIVIRITIITQEFIQANIAILIIINICKGKQKLCKHYYNKPFLLYFALNNRKQRTPTRFLHRLFLEEKAEIGKKKIQNNMIFINLSPHATYWENRTKIKKWPKISLRPFLHGCLHYYYYWTHSSNRWNNGM